MSDDERGGPEGRSTFSALVAGAAARGRDSLDCPGYRDKNPPRSWSGEDPENTFQALERNVRLWECETDVLRSKRGVKLMRVMQGLAAVAMEELSFEDIACEDGVRNVLGKLKEFFMPQLEDSLPRAFEAAVYGPARSAKEGFAECTGRMERAFNRLSREGVDLPEGAQGYILYRQASLGEHQEQRLLTWGDGK